MVPLDVQSILAVVLRGAVIIAVAAEKDNKTNLRAYRTLYNTHGRHCIIVVVFFVFTK